MFATVFSIVGWRPAPSYATRSQQSGFILVASDNPGSDPIGFAHVLEVPGSNHLEQLSVMPSAANRGHGRALVEAVKSGSRLRGCKRVTLRTFADVPSRSVSSRATARTRVWPARANELRPDR